MFSVFTTLWKAPSWDSQICQQNHLQELIDPQIYKWLHSRAPFSEDAFRKLCHLARSKCASETLWSKVLQSWVPTAGWVLSPSGVQPVLTQAAICLQVLGTPCVLLMSHYFYYYTFYLCACLSVCGCDHVSTGVPGGQRHRVPLKLQERGVVSHQVGCWSARQVRALSHESPLQLHLFSVFFGPGVHLLYKSYSS